MPFDQNTPRPFRIVSVQMFAPIESGVYGISNADQWIYIGETDNIRAALMSHLREVNTPLMNRQPTGFVFELCESSHRPARQDRLVLEYEPACNRQSPMYS